MSRKRKRKKKKNQYWRRHKPEEQEEEKRVGPIKRSSPVAPVRFDTKGHPAARRPGVARRSR